MSRRAGGEKVRRTPRTNVVPDFHDGRPSAPWNWRIGALALVGIVGLPTIGLVAANHLVHQAEAQRADHVSGMLLIGYLVLMGMALGLTALGVGMLRRRDQARDTAAGHYRALADATPDGVAIVDEVGRMMYANPALIAMLGVGTPDTWQGHPVTEWTGMSDGDGVDLRAPVIERGEALPVVLMNLLHADGHRIPVEGHAGPIDIGGRPGLISVLRDLTKSRAAEAAVAVAEARQRTVIETVSDGIVFYDLDAQRRPVPLMMNPAAVEFCGCTFEELAEGWTRGVGPKFLDADGQRLPPEDIPVAVVARRGTPVRGVVLGMRTTEGKLRWLRATANPVHDHTGTMIGIVAGLVDITTERNGRSQAEADRARFEELARAARRSELALRDSEERLRQAFEHAPIGIALISLEGRYEQVNPAMCRITGYSDGQLRKLTLADTTHPEDLDADRAGMGRLLRGEATSYTMDKRYRSPTGNVVWTTKSASLVCADDGSPLHFVAQVQDITGRKEQEQILADERRRLRDAQSIGHVGSWERDLTTGTTVWSDSLFELYGVRPEDFDSTYEAALSCVHPDDRATVSATIERCMLLGTPVHVRYRVIRGSDGALRWCDAHGEPLYEGGRVARIGGAVADVTDLVLAEVRAKEARDVALEASRQKSAFLATMSHEIRTPMNAVIGMTGLLLDTPLDADQREFVETVRSSGDALLCIINDILDFSKIEAGGMTLERQSFDLRDCTDSALELVAATSSGPGVEIVGDVDDLCPTRVVGDVTRLRQVLVNLLGNAVKFTPGGEVVLSVAPDESGAGDARLRFSVTDTGIGIPADRLGSLFDSFSQVDGSTTRLYGGTGLGLAISRRLVEAMGGSLVVESVSGEGTTFSFSIDLGRSGPDDEGGDGGHLRHRGQGPVSDLTSRLRGRSVLLVDDNATSRRTIRARLDGWGMRIAEAAGGAAARALIESNGPFDVAVVDMQMPGMTGQELAVMLRRWPATQRMPLILLCSRVDRRRVDRDDLFSAVLTKPVKRDRLREELTEALGSGVDVPVLETTPLRPESPRPDPLRVLLAEDNAVNQRLGRLMLERLGHRVDVVADGREAVEAVRLLPYDVVLMDVEMPHLDGLEATRIIRREVPATRQPQIVAMTASVLVEARQACGVAGMDDYLPKPVHLEDLELVLRRVSDHIDLTMTGAVAKAEDPLPT